MSLIDPLAAAVVVEPGIVTRALQASVAVSLAHVAARQELRNLMMAMGLEQVIAPLDVAA